MYSLCKTTPNPPPIRRANALKWPTSAATVFLTWTGWQVASILGIVLASQVPLSWGLGFAGVLALVGILCSLASSRMRTVSLVISGAAAVAAYALPLRLNILVAIAAAVAMCLLIEKTAGLNKAAHD